MTIKKPTCDVCGRELEEDDEFMSCPYFIEYGGVLVDANEHTSYPIR